MTKALFSHSCGGPRGGAPPLVRERESGIRQRRYWEHTIRDERDYAAQIDYIHFNPVKHGLAAHASDWLFSSFAGCVWLGMYASAWVMRGAGLDDTGERQ